MSAMKVEMEGLVEAKREDGGMARIADIEGDGCLFVRLQSWDETCEHSEFTQFEGRRVRVTVEIL
jgi:hypothetical protein